jgi:hypothetical protein
LVKLESTLAAASTDTVGSALASSKNTVVTGNDGLRNYSVKPLGFEDKLLTLRSSHIMRNDIMISGVGLSTEKNGVNPS